MSILKAAFEDAPAPAASVLARVRRGVRPAPDRVLVVGTEGVGKSTFAAGFPSPIFVAAEDGVRHLDVASVEPASWGEVLAIADELAAGDHGYRTFVLDTLDWAEPLAVAHVCAARGWSDIEAPGYGKGYLPLADEWRGLLARLDRLRAARGMEIVLLAHAAIRTFSNPAGRDYSRYESKLARASAAVVREWADMCLFAAHEDLVVDPKGAERPKGVSTGARLLRTERTAAWDAKNRHGLPPEIPLDYAAFVEARAAGQPAAPEALAAEISSLIAGLDPDKATRKTMEAAVAAANGEARRLAALANRLRVLARQKKGGA